MSNKKNRAKARAARAEQTIAKLRTECVSLRSELENARKSHAHVLRKLNETVNILQAEEKYLKPWRITVDGLMRGGMRFQTYQLVLQIDPFLINQGFRYMQSPQCSPYDRWQNNGVAISLLCEQMARDAEKKIHEVMEKDGVLR